MAECAMAVRGHRCVVDELGHLARADITNADDQSREHSKIGRARREYGFRGLHT